MSDNKMTSLPTLGSLKGSTTGLPKLSKLTLPGKGLKSKAEPAKEEAPKEEKLPETPAVVEPPKATTTVDSSKIEEEQDEDVTTITSADEFLDLLTNGSSSSSMDDDWATDGLKSGDSAVISSENLTKASRTSQEAIKVSVNDFLKSGSDDSLNDDDLMSAKTQAVDPSEFENEFNKLNQSNKVETPSSTLNKVNKIPAAVPKKSVTSLPPIAAPIPVADKSKSIAIKLPMTKVSSVEAPKIEIKPIGLPPKSSINPVVAPDPVSVEAPKAEEAAVETPKAEDAAVEAPKAEEAAVEAPKAEETAVEAPKAEETAVEAPKAEEAAVEAPKAEEDAVEAPKAEEDAVEAPKVEPPAAPVSLSKSAPVAPKMSDEERAAYEQEQMLASMTDEERAAYEQEQMLANMSDEERAAYEQEQMFANMTDEERAAYEREQRRLAQEAEDRREQNLREQREYYLQELQERRAQKSNAGIVIVVVVILLVGAIGGLLYKFSSDAEEKAKQEAQAIAEAKAAEEAAQVPQKTVFDEKINWYGVNVSCPNGAVIYVNGVETEASDVKFAQGHTNTIIAYSEGMVPFFQSYTKDEAPTSITIEFEPDDLFAKSIVEFKLKDATLKGSDLKAKFDGRTINRFPVDISGVVMGVPHTLVLEKPGYAPLYQLIWPVRPKGSAKATVNVAKMESTTTALGGTSVATKKFPLSDKPYGILIKSGNTSYQSTDTIIDTPHGAFVDYHFTREQRVPLQLGVYPDKYGTVMVEPQLKQKSLGEALVSFKGAPKNLQICFRREGEVICPDMNAESSFPSGQDWVAVAYTTNGSNKKVLNMNQGQPILMHYNYVFNVNAKGNDVVLKPESHYMKDHAKADKK